MEDYKLYAIKSPEDERDWVFSSSQKPPVYLDLRPDLLPARNQGNQGTCYAQAASCAKEWQEKKDYGFNNYFSPQFFYDQRFNIYDENKNNDFGMFGRDVMKLLKNTGICEENVYPYGKIQHKDKIPLEIYEQAKKHCIKAYAKINDIENLKKSIYVNGPCLVAFPVYNYTDQMWNKRENESFKGGHAMTIVGYTYDSFIIYGL
jgi:C1A family cysteine protease